ncbi:MAG TPA: MT-A70 family methyltransferase, partial [Atribacterota bacterium]|nr:MT-A70 family methyltransferase [Atribacterota bacterium]
LLIATKGTHITPENPQETLRSSVIFDPEDFKIEHSRKPDTYYELIETEYPGRRYLELFARAQRPGWETFSNEPELRAA